MSCGLKKCEQKLSNLEVFVFTSRKKFHPRKKKMGKSDNFEKGSHNENWKIQSPPEHIYSPLTWLKQIHPHFQNVDNFRKGKTHTQVQRSDFRDSAKVKRLRRSRDGLKLKRRHLEEGLQAARWRRSARAEWAWTDGVSSLIVAAGERRGLLGVGFENMMRSWVMKWGAQQGLGVVVSRWLEGGIAGRMGWGAIACHLRYVLFRICLCISAFCLDEKGCWRTSILCTHKHEFLCVSHLLH